MKCLSNLYRCHASCCKILPFNLSNLTKNQIEQFKTEKILYFNYPFLSKDLIYYYRLHGCSVTRNQNRSYIVIVPSKGVRIMKMSKNRFLLQITVPCTALKDNLCILHDTGKKPYVCRQLTKDFYSRFYITEGCLVIDNKDAIKFDEKKEV